MTPCIAPNPSVADDLGSPNKINTEDGVRERQSPFLVNNKQEKKVAKMLMVSPQF